MAAVEISLVLESETFRGEDLDIGSWVNVIGYVSCVQSDEMHAINSQFLDEDRDRKVKGASSRRRTLVNVQATMLWSAGSLRLDLYEQIVQLRTDSEGSHVQKTSYES